MSNTADRCHLSERSAQRRSFTAYWTFKEAGWVHCSCKVVVNLNFVRCFFLVHPLLVWKKHFLYFTRNFVILFNSNFASQFVQQGNGAEGGPDLSQWILTWCVGLHHKLQWMLRKKEHVNKVQWYSSLTEEEEASSLPLCFCLFVFFDLFLKLPP